MEGNKASLSKKENKQRGLKFKSNGNGTCYLKGTGFFLENNVVIPVVHKGMRVTGIDQFAFQNCKNLTSVSIPASITAIGESAFYNCEGLTSLEIPDSVTKIHDGAFFGCSGLTAITIPTGITKINSWLFSYCSHLTSVIIPDSVTSIGRSAFRGCHSLKRIDISEHVTSIGEHAFDICQNLANIEVSPNNPNYASVDGVLFNKEKTELIHYPDAKTGDYIIPDGVKTIMKAAFKDHKHLTRIVIPSSVTAIGHDAFSLCKKLETIRFMGTVDEWNEISKGYDWRNNIPATKVICANGAVSFW